MLNQATLIGRLGTDPEMTQVNGTNKTKLRIATSRKYKDKNGELQEKTQWHNISVWGNQAESCAKYLTKGRMVCVVGEIEYSKSEKDGVERWFTDIRANSVQFLPSGNQDNNQGNQNQGNNGGWGNNNQGGNQGGWGNQGNQGNQNQGNQGAWGNQNQPTNQGAWGNQNQPTNQGNQGNQGGSVVPF